MTSPPDDSTVTRLPRLDRRGELPLPGTLLGGRFRLEGEVGRGGSGVVFAARDELVGQRVAIKVVDPALITEHTRERLQREVSASRPAHPNAVTIYELYDSDGFLYLAMELVEGVSLRDRLRDGGPLTVAETETLGRQVAAALAHLHARGLVHRDVKPGNILLDRSGLARLCDTGLARPLGAGATVTESQMVVGTPAYMAPEQATATELTAASDVYSLGLTLHACLTGEVPRTQSTALATLMQRARARPPRVRRSAPHCPHWLARLIRRMLEPRPGDRPTAAEVVRMLASGRVWPRPPRRQLLATAAVVGAVMVAATVWLAVPHGQAVRIDVAEGELRGFDTAGRRVWRMVLDGQVRQVDFADLDGDGVNEAIVVTSNQQKGGRGDPRAYDSQVVVVDGNRRVLTRLRPQERLLTWGFPYPPLLDPNVQVADLDGDGGPEVIATCSQVAYYPTVVFVWWPRQDVWRHVLNHPGRIYALAAAPEADGPGFVFFAANNLLGLLPVVGELQVAPPSVSTQDTRLNSPCGSPPTTLGRCGSGYLRDYVLLGEPLLHRGMGVPSLEPRPGGGLRATYTGGSVLLDGYGNPDPGPNVGHDRRRMRSEFYVALSRLTPLEQPLEVAGVATILADAERSLGPLLAEPPYRASLDVVGAQALARLGAGDQARALLDRTVAVAPYEGVRQVRAQLAALAGELDTAVGILRPMVDAPVTQRGRFDAPVLLMHIAIERRDRREVGRCIATLSAPTVQAARGERILTDALWARPHLWWDEAGPVDCQAETSSLVSAGEALAVLARWRLGRSRPEDAATMQELAASVPDAAGEARLALAAAHLANGDLDASLAELASLVQQLESTATVEFADRQLLDLASGLLATAQAAAGDCAAARSTADALLATATPDLLPAILAREASARCRG